MEQPHQYNLQKPKFKTKIQHNPFKTARVVVRNHPQTGIKLAVQKPAQTYQNK